MLLRLLRLGLSWAEARQLSYEEVLCLLWHARLHESLERLEQEVRTLFAVPFADPHELLKAQNQLQQRQNRLLSEFNRDY